MALGLFVMLIIGMLHYRLTGRTGPLSRAFHAPTVGGRRPAG